MPEMLEQAILDADELRKHAMQLAEQTLVKKHAEELKKTMNKLLEQEDLFGGSDLGNVGNTPDPGMGLGDPMLEEESSENELSEEIKDQIPTSGTEMLEENSDELEIDFEVLKSQMRDQNLNLPDVNLNISQSSNISNTSNSSQVPTSPVQMENVENSEDLEDLDEDVDLLSLFENYDEDEEDLTTEELEETVKNFDFELKPHGHIGKATTQELEYRDDIQKVKDVQGLKEEYRKLQKSLKLYKEKVQILENSQNEQVKKFEHLKEQINKVNISNCKLLLSNKVLRSDSLNERQKSMMVEKLSNAKTVDEAKMIFETLQVAVEGKKKPSKSLNESLTRTNILHIPPKQEVSNVEDLKNNAVIKRMQQLAGIKK